MDTLDSIAQCYRSEKHSVDWSDKWMWISIASIIFNPTFWNIVARREYKAKFITRIFGGNSLYGCYALAATIFILGLIRDGLFKVAIDLQPRAECMSALPLQVVGVLLFAVGNVFVLSSMYVLGVTGTYLGDYFGILMDSRVTSFPFNVNDNPMYNGSVMVFLGTALWERSPAGVYLSCVVLFVYRIALKFEGPFTSMIYQKRDEARAKDAISNQPAAKKTRKATKVL
ncbi:Phosphatidyl-N-methylethanolamine N-methyltransferase [Actinomortierella ambigua]|uniref:Phosphatidyl-N-methylethanolamine N-methyltransferase n=1 Tax=Actinomortierella ambigua TaxID=1343610 RepID=A0A9P6UC15_9FUNG|nr:Phosphatidyl-N-methylethanolamine N-methyltransferase [Actinomortierella ambigua]KAG0268388.1 Phosphatidyl-N-methylethanolamine N-methyltransferase [Actinomortierella ambigua]